MDAYSNIIEDNSSLSQEYSDSESSKLKESIILDSLKSKIDKRKKELESDDSILENYTSNDFQKIPDYNIISSFDIQNYYNKVQKWIGIVESISEFSFKAKLIDKSSMGGTYEMAEFEFDEISPSDRHLIEIGAIFYWSIGYANKKGQISKESLIRFKRSVPFTEDNLDKIVDQASFLEDSINWE